MREMKDSGIEWIGNIPADWNIKRVKAVLCERNESNNPIQTDEILSLTNDRGVIPYEEKGDVGNKSKEDLTGYKLAYPGDIVLNSMNVFIGSVGLSSYFGCVSPVYYMLYPRNKNDSVSFFNYLFQTKELQTKLHGYGNGIMEIRMRIQMSKLNSVQLPVPPSDVQHKIAAHLDRKCSQIDAIIARQQEVIEKLKAYKLSVITEAVTKGLNPDVPMKDSGVEWIGEIPEHWEIRRIGSFARVTSSKRIFEESYVDEGVPFYRSKEITDLSKGLHVQTEIFIPEEVFEQVNEASPAPKCGDILLTSIGTIGNTWISDGRKFYYKDGNITQIEANDSFDSAYVEYCFSSNVVLEQYTRLAMGSTLLALTIIKIKKILVAFPPLDEQRKIVQYLKLKCSSIDAAIKNKENLITKLVDYKKSLIYEVVTGKKEV